MKRTRITAVLCAFMLLCSVAGCGSQGGSGQGDASQGTGQNVSGNQDETWTDLNQSGNGSQGQSGAGVSSGTGIDSETGDLSGSGSASEISDAAGTGSETGLDSGSEYANRRTEAPAKGELSNPNANEKTKAIYTYLCDNFGTTMLSCQQESTWMGSPDYEMNYIMEQTGKLPAMRGLDFMNQDFNGVVSRAKSWSEQGGLVTICWHTGVAASGYQESLKESPNFDKLLTEGTDEYNTLMESWDQAAKALKELEEADVTVLWRPFHEFDGKWFWWGKGGGDNFVKLWQLMYDKFTYEYELNNLIWVLGYSGEVVNGWYPGDMYCDIIGSDTYDGTTNKKAWNRLVQIADKPLAYHECGNIPTTDAFLADGTVWSWFMIWHTDYITGFDPENLSEIYNSDLVITLDELPEF